MADTNTTTTVLNNLMQSYFSKQMIVRLEPKTPLVEFAQKEALPLGNGTTAIFNGWTSLAAASVALAEGTANSLPALSSRKVTGTIAGYGRGVKLTDLAAMTAIFDAVNGAMDVLTDSAAKTVEAMIQMGIFKNGIASNANTNTCFSGNMSAQASGLCATTAGSYALGRVLMQFPVVFGTSCGRMSAVLVTAPSISAQLSLYSIRKAVTKLRKNNARPYADGNFVGYAHPNALAVLCKDPTFVQWNAYQNSKETMYTGEVGRTWGVRWVSSSMCPRYAATAHSVNLSFIFGQQAFGFTTLDGNVKMLIAKGPDKSDPWDQFTDVTYKVYGVAVALNPSAGVILATHEKL